MILALYDARAEVAYWLVVREYFEALPGFDLAHCPQRVTVSIPQSNMLDPRAMKALARLKNQWIAHNRRDIIHAL